MTRALLVLATLTAGLSTAHPAPVVSIRARTEVSLDPIRRESGGVRVSGQVRELGSGNPVPLAQLQVNLDDQPSWVTTSADGRFSVWLIAEGDHHTLTVEFPGDLQFDGADVRLDRLDLKRRPLLLDLQVAANHERSAGDLQISVYASSEVDPASVPLQLHLGTIGGDTPRLVSESHTDSSGVAKFSIPGDELGAPGRLRVMASSPGNVDFDPAAAETTVILRSLSSITFELQSTSLDFNGRLLGRGRLTDDIGNGLAEQSVELKVLTATAQKTVDEALTDDQGRFALLAKVSEFGPGAHKVQASFSPVSSYIDASRSPPVQIDVAARRPIPVGYSIAAFAAAIASILAFVAVRNKPWERWLQRVRAQSADTDDPAASPGRSRSPERRGLALARPSLVSTLRRANDRGFSGTIASAGHGRPLPGAVVVLGDGDQYKAVADGAGRFAIEELPDGELPGQASAPGHVTERFQVSIPHRGELRGARIDLLPVREHIFGLYRQVAEGLLPSREFWGVWTPRQILDHVRVKMAPGPLLALTDYVEEAYFSGREPQESEIPAAQAVVDAAAQHLSRVDRKQPSE